MLKCNVIICAAIRAVHVNMQYYSMLHHYMYVYIQYQKLRHAEGNLSCWIFSCIVISATNLLWITLIFIHDNVNSYRYLVKYLVKYTKYLHKKRSRLNVNQLVLIMATSTRSLLQLQIQLLWCLKLSVATSNQLTIAKQLTIDKFVKIFSIFIIDIQAEGKKFSQLPQNYLQTFRH